MKFLRFSAGGGFAVKKDLNRLKIPVLLISWNTLNLYNINLLV